jgi:hypothetical protein
MNGQHLESDSMHLNAPHYLLAAVLFENTLMCLAIVENVVL